MTTGTLCSVYQVSFAFAKGKIPFKQKVLYLTVLIHNFQVNLMILVILANLVNRDKVSHLSFFLWLFSLKKLDHCFCFFKYLF